MGKEAVWDYPRPPRLERTSKRLQVVFAGEKIADTTSGFRVLETSHPPVYYIPREHVKAEYLVASPRRTFCEFKGSASYWSVQVGDQSVENAAWSYEHPSAGYASIRGCLAFYAGKMDRCLVGEETVLAQPGSFYGGWITADITGLPDPT